MRTFSVISIVLVASLSSTLFAQDCNNPLLGLYGLIRLDDPQSGADLPFCSNLQIGGTCCSVDTVAGFQDKANGIIDKLNNYFAAKDLYLAQLRNSYFDRFTDLLQDINENHTNDLQTIRTTDSGVADQLQAEIDLSTQLSNDARSIDDQFAEALTDYQTARTTCFTFALQVQASAWCTACDPNYATQGVADDGTVTFSDGLCQALSDNCWPFFNEGARFNPLIRAREAYWRLAAVSTYLNNFSNSNQVVPFDVSPDPYSPLISQRTLVVPDQWVGGAERKCTDLFAGDQQLAELLTFGTSVPVPIEGNEPGANSRLLQDVLAGDEGIWAPAFLETGLDFSLLFTDPGDFFGVNDLSDSLNQPQNNDNENDDVDNDSDDDDVDVDVDVDNENDNDGVNVVVDTDNDQTDNDGNVVVVTPGN